MIKSFSLLNTKRSLLLILFLCLYIGTSNLQAQGPTSPEATAFEPVDANDMVNLVSGDFSYVIPLTVVPSPEGGYPIALSYHAGIAMDQEASWVGLGWTLNVGAINRSVNGYPDDWKNGKISSILYDDGGEAKSFYISKNIGIPTIGSVGSTLSYTENRTYGGETSYRFDVDFHASIGLNDSFSINGSIGTSGVGFGGGFGVGKLTNHGNYGGSVGFNFFQSFKNGENSFTFSFKTSINKANAVGINFSSGSNLGLSIGSGRITLSGSNHNTELTTLNENHKIIIPIPISPLLYTFGLGYSRTRYYLFDNQYNSCYGALYPGSYKEGREASLNPEKTFADNVESLYKLDKESQLQENNMSFIAKDSYRVNAQGISGSMSPAFFDSSTLMLKHHIKSKIYYFGQDKIIDNNLDDSFNDLHFYFDNSFSSYLRTTPGVRASPSTNINRNDLTNLDIQNRNFITSTNINGKVKSGYNQSTKRKRDGHVVEVFTNAEITNSNIIEVNSSSGFNRNSLKNDKDYKDGIGAYKVTSLDGKTYHYSLPVYQKEKISRISEKEKNDELHFRESMSFTPYATHWLLTAITGPDYYDKNNNGRVDKGDYGYWVEFDYGKWSDGFAWSSPVNEIISKYSKNSLTYFETNTSKSYSWGVKEIYYLDKIRTRTHTAFFIKENRDDNFSTRVSYNSEKYKNIQIRKRQSIGDVTYIYGFESATFNHSNYNYNNLFYAEGHYDYSTNMNKQSSLKLKEIIILKNENIPSTFQKTNSNVASKKAGDIRIKQTNKFFKADDRLLGSEVLFYQNTEYYGESYNNVYDFRDNKIPSDKIIQAIKFQYEDSNQLAKGTPNSQNGKLTLKGVSLKGKNGISLIPPYKFAYNKNFSYNYERMDDWGYYKNNSSAWSLNSIKTPVGTTMKINYESDDYDEDLFGKYETYNNNLQFIFSEQNGKLRIRVSNEQGSENPIDFTKKFQRGTALMNLWLCYKRDYRDWTCQTRSGSIDIQNQSLNITSVTSTELIIEADISLTSNYRGGLGEIYDEPIGLNHHPGNGLSSGMIREEEKKGVCSEPPGCDNVSPRLVLDYSLKGNKINEDKDQGGIRVKQIELTDGNKSYYKRFYYNEEGYDKDKSSSNYKSSGVTSYTPSKFFKEVKYISELPLPSVMYNRVTVEDIGTDLKSEQKTIYKFRTINTEELIDNDDEFKIPNFLEIKVIRDNNYNVNVNSVASKVNFKKYEITKNSSSLGQLLSKETINSNNQILTKVKNDYTELKDAKQGIYQESMDVYKQNFNNENEDVYDYLINTTSVLNYTSVLEKTVATQGGFQVVKNFDTHDFLTGQVLETKTYASDGTAFKNKIVPAYTKYAGMGSKTDDINNANMLSQVAAHYSYVLESNNYVFESNNNQEKIVGAGITTWNNDWVYSYVLESNNMWRKHKTYTWKGNIDRKGFYVDFNQSNDDEFVWRLGAAQTNSKWQQTSETTLYDHYSMPLEYKDINGNHAAKKMCDNNTKVLATANAAYTEMYYCGLEYAYPYNNFDGGVKAYGIKTSPGHTGTYAIKSSAGQNAFEVTVPANSLRNTERKKRFKVSVWVKKTQKENVKIKTYGSGYAYSFKTEETQIAGDWALLNGYITISENETKVVVTSTNGTIEVDDFRLHPITSSMTSYVYNEWDEVSYITGANGLSTHYIYDKLGRLKETQVEVLDFVDNNGDPKPGGFKKVSENKYNYKK